MEGKAKNVLFWLLTAVGGSVIGVGVGKFFELGPFVAPAEIRITQFSFANQSGIEHIPQDERLSEAQTLAEDRNKIDIVVSNSGGEIATQCFPQLNYTGSDGKYQEPTNVIPGSPYEFSLAPGGSVPVSFNIAFPQLSRDIVKKKKHNTDFKYPWWLVRIRAEVTCFNDIENLRKEVNINEVSESWSVQVFSIPEASPP